MEAKIALSKIVKSLATEGPQILTVRGKPTAVLISFEQFEKKFGKSSQPSDSKE